MSPSQTLLLQNARIIDPANNIDELGDLLVAEGIIKEKGSYNFV